MVCDLVYCHHEVSHDCNSQSNFLALCRLMLKLPQVMCNSDLANVALAERNIASSSTKTFAITPVNLMSGFDETKN